jgi:hypothetical protein
MKLKIIMVLEMIIKKYGGSMFFGAILLAGLVSYQLMLDMQTQSINDELSKRPSSAGENVFQQFDATQFTQKHPWLGDKVTVLYENQLLGTGNHTTTPPQEAQVKKVLSGFKGSERLILGISSWVIMSNGKVDDLANQHIAWYLQVLSWARDVLPQTNLGFVIPANDLASDGLPLLTPVIRVSDAFYPTFDVSQDNFDKVAFTMTDAILIAKSLLKPVFPFMWHRGSGGSYQDKILPDAIIEQQCKFVRENANGLVWWSGLGETWSDIWYPAAEECFK